VRLSAVCWLVGNRLGEDGRSSNDGRSRGLLLIDCWYHGMAALPFGASDLMERLRGGSPNESSAPSWCKATAELRWVDLRKPHWICAPVQRYFGDVSCESSCRPGLSVKLRLAGLVQLIARHHRRWKPLKSAHGQSLVINLEADILELRSGTDYKNSRCSDRRHGDALIRR